MGLKLRRDEALHLAKNEAMLIQTNNQQTGKSIEELMKEFYSRTDIDKPKEDIYSKFRPSISETAEYDPRFDGPEKKPD